MRMSGPVTSAGIEAAAKFQALFGDPLCNGGVDGTDDPRRRKSDFHLAIQIMCKAALDKARSEAPSTGSDHGRPSGLNPTQG